MAGWAAIVCPGSRSSAQSDWHGYRVYEPRVENHYVTGASDPPPGLYNHCSTMAWFVDRWYAIWNANVVRGEGKPGQKIYFSTSLDGKQWLPRRALFADPELSDPAIPAQESQQWQPSSIVDNGELWVIWSYAHRGPGSEKPFRGCWLSKLTKPGAKWTSRKVLFGGKAHVTIQGKNYAVFPTQNAARLRSGRVLVPVTLMTGGRAEGAPPYEELRWADRKIDSVIYTDDGGQTWGCSEGTSLPRYPWAQWEPTVWEQDDGTVMMLARTQDDRTPKKGGFHVYEYLKWAISRDRGETWTAQDLVPLETAISRPHVVPCGPRTPLGTRYIMTHHDAADILDWSTRHNLALYFNRGTGFDFAPGITYTGIEPGVSYPHLWIHDDAIWVIYSTTKVTGIRVARISPLPDPNQLYIMMRNHVRAGGPPRTEGNAAVFSGNQKLETRSQVQVDQNGFSMAAWVRPAWSHGTIFDFRPDGQASGAVFGIKGPRPFVNFKSREGDLMPDAEIPSCALNQWHYVGVTIDNRAGEARFFVNDQVRTVPFSPVEHPLSGTTGYLGGVRPKDSALVPLTGALRFFALYPSSRLDRSTHAAMHNLMAAELGRTALEGARLPATRPALWVDTARPGTLGSAFRAPEEIGNDIRTMEVAGVACIRIGDNASAGIELAANSRADGDQVGMRFRFRVLAGDSPVIASCGDVTEPARLTVCGGRLTLVSRTDRRDLGAIRGDGWNDVQMRTGNYRTYALVNGGGEKGVRHRPAATWLYFGNAFVSDRVESEGVFAIDVGSVQTRVAQHE